MEDLSSTISYVLIAMLSLLFGIYFWVKSNKTKTNQSKDLTDITRVLSTTLENAFHIQNAIKLESTAIDERWHHVSVAQLALSTVKRSLLDQMIDREIPINQQFSLLSKNELYRELQEEFITRISEFERQSHPSPSELRLRKLRELFDQLSEDIKVLLEVRDMVRKFDQSNQIPFVNPMTSTCNYTQHFLKLENPVLRELVSQKRIKKL